MDLTPIAQSIKVKTNWDSVTLSSFYTTRKKNSKMKGELNKWEITFVKHMSRQGLISKIYKVLIQLNSKWQQQQQQSQFKNEQRMWIEIFTKKIHKWPIGIWKMLNTINHQRNANQNHNETLPQPVCMATTKSQK